MCTMIMQKEEIAGSGKGARGWFPLRQVNVSFDHADHANLEHAVSIDFVNEAEGLDARVAVELDPDSARQLVKAILTSLELGEALQ